MAWRLIALLRSALASLARQRHSKRNVINHVNEEPSPGPNSKRVADCFGNCPASRHRWCTPRRRDVTSSVPDDASKKYRRRDFETLGECFGLTSVQLAPAAEHGGHDALPAKFISQVHLFEPVLFHQITQHLRGCGFRQCVLLRLVSPNLSGDKIEQRYKRM